MRCISRAKALAEPASVRSLSIVNAEKASPPQYPHYLKISPKNTSKFWLQAPVQKMVLLSPIILAVRLISRTIRSLPWQARFFPWRRQQQKHCKVESGELRVTIIEAKRAKMVLVKTQCRDLPVILALGAVSALSMGQLLHMANRLGSAISAI